MTRHGCANRGDRNVVFAPSTKMPPPPPPAFAAAARGAGVTPWRLDFGMLEEDIFNMAAAQPTEASPKKPAAPGENSASRTQVSPGCWRIRTPPAGACFRRPRLARMTATQTANVTIFSGMAKSANKRSQPMRPGESTESAGVAGL